MSSSSMSLSVLVIVAALSGCSVVSNLGEDDAGGGRDAASIQRGPYDECGNGMDDDGDGMIDEGCPCGLGETQSCFSGDYPFRGVGLCADGMQACDVEPGVEFGTWGACTADRLPGEQLCDGADGDCDGAVDEGCPCTAGQTQECGVEFVTEPCRGGTQTCTADGVWTSCEGAIGPSPETCDDDVDNDCDGMVNEGCGCVPVPEICGDGVDNDCDGSVDEPGCGGSSFDAGVGSDAGSPDAALVDAGPIVTCDTADLRWDRVSRPTADPVVSGRNTSSAVWTGSEHVFAFQGGDGTTTFNSDVYIARYDADGNHIATELVLDLDGSFRTFYGLVWTGAELVVAYGNSGALNLQRVRLDGTLVGSPVPLPGGGSIAWDGAQIGAVYATSGASGVGLYFRRYDPSLSALGAEVEIVAPSTVQRPSTAIGHGLAHTGQRWIVAWTETGADITEATAHLAVLTDTAVQSTRALTSAGGGSGVYSSPSVAAGADTGLVCWQHIFGMWDFEFLCERLDGLGSPAGAQANLTGRLRTMGGAVGLSRWGSSYVLIFADTTSRSMGGASGSFIWRDGGAAPEVIAVPSDMNLRRWGFSYWDSAFGLLEAGRDLIIQGRGDLIAGDPTRRGYTFSRVRLRCAL